MKRDWMANDRVVNHICSIVERCAQPLSLEVLSVILYGSRAQGEHNSQSDYDIMVLLDEKSSDLKKFIFFNDVIKLELLKEKFFRVKILTYTNEIFEDILYNDTVVGTFLYMICRDSIVLYDKLGTFTAIKEKLAANSDKDEGRFLNQCIEFARMFGSEKWERKWEKTLMQFKYLKNRREF